MNFRTLNIEKQIYKKVLYRAKHYQPALLDNELSNKKLLSAKTLYIRNPKLKSEKYPIYL